MTTSRRERGAAAVAVVAAVTPIAVAAARAVTGGWMPIGDNAYFSIRARDVLTVHHPLVGTWTSASQAAGVDLNNPGPLLFDLLALPARLHPDWGVALGVAVINAACVIAVAAVARRVGGVRAVVAAMAAASAMAWSMGSELLFDPWQPHSLLFPCLLLLVLCWGLACGRLLLLPAVVGVASLLVGTHLSYGVLVPAVAGGATVAAMTHARGRGRDAGRAVLASVVVAAVCWAQPLAEQVSGSLGGNLGELARHGGRGGEVTGWSTAARLVGTVLGLPPFWGRPAFDRFLVGVEVVRIPSLATAATGLGVVVVVLAVLLARTLRRGDQGRPAAAASGLALVAVAASLVTAARLPIGTLGLAAHQLRWLWPVGAFLAFAVVLALAGAVRHPAVPAGLAAVAVAFGALSLPHHNARQGPSADAAAIPPTVELLRGLDRLDVAGPVLFDERGLRFAEPYSVAVMADLQRRGIEFRVADPVLAHQLGPSRHVEDRGALPRLVQRDGDASFTSPEEGAELVSRVVGLRPAERREMAALRTAIAEHVAGTGLRLDADGRALQRLGAYGAFAAADGPVVRDADGIIASGDLIRALREDVIHVDPAWRPRFERFAALQDRWNRHTVALWLVPAATP